MTREEAIRYIEFLFPPDSDYKETAEVGQALLERAKREVSRWKDEPTAVLVRLAELQIMLDNGEIKNPLV